MKQHLLKILLSLVVLAIGLNTQAQNNLGHHSDNYSGVYSLSYNPAEIVDSRYRFHMNIIGLGFTASNNYIGIKRKALFPERDIAFNSSNFSDDYLVERLNGKKKGVYVNTDVMLPLSFMFNFGKKHNNALAFNSRLRFQVNADGIAENLATMSFNEILLANLYNVGIQNKNFSLQTNAWTEYGITYGRDIINKGKHFVSAAGTIKLTQGLANAYFYSDNLDVTFPTDSTVSVANSDIKFGYSSILGSDLANPSSGNILGNIGVGFDLGAVWEFRPDIDKYKYEMNGDPDWLDHRKEKYMLKVGFSLMDMGFTSYQRANGVFGEYNANRANVDIDESFGAAFDDFANTGLQGFQDTLASLYTETVAPKGSYKVALPTKINVFVDYRIWRGFYANFSASIAPAFKKNPEKTRGISEFSITPRYEHKWFGFYLPVSVNTHGNPHLGTGMRVGPLVIGTNDILPLMGKKTIYDANFYMNLSIPIAKKLKDKDGDHVRNNVDNCKKEPGAWANKGCPDQDRDKDGIMDADDACIDVPGIKAFNGCPDTDGDGIQDSEDNCPEVPGIAEFKGCPDTDGDGIMDSEDDCPEVAGVKAFKGCPDTDGDGIQDSEDDCPEVAGIKAFNGCPDTDGDGLKDSEDNCPTVAGPKDNKGCPYGDKDGDGVPDKDDECIETPGPKSNNGCPVIEKDVEEALDLAFKNLEFESGKAIIKTSSYPSLESLSEIMKSHPEFKLLLSGHTDNVGNDANNLVLSQKRAEAVKTFLEGKGVKGANITTEYFGETKPKATNDTPEGRQMNRRVEMKINFE